MEKKISTWSAHSLRSTLAANQKPKVIGTVLLSFSVFIVSHTTITTFNMLIAYCMFPNIMLP